MDDRIELFRDFLRIPSVSAEGPKGVYKEAVDFLVKVATAKGLQTEVIEFVPNKPLLLCKWQVESGNGSILLNGHYDVVPVEREKWSYDPFEAHMDEEGRIFARGAQDMKCVCLQHIEALGNLKASGFQPSHSIYIAVVPDEEIGGADGVGRFVQSERFTELDVRCVLDEGLASVTNSIPLFFAERVVWWIKLIAEGKSGHGSRFIKDTAIEKLLKVLEHAMKFRERQEKEHECGKHLGEVVSLNVTTLSGGSALNVVPGRFEATLDVRISPNFSAEAFQNLLDEWTAQEGISYTLLHHQNEFNVSPTDRSNVFWNSICSTLETMDIPFEPQIFPAGTDSRFYRALGIPAFGFSPIRNTPVLLHDHDEFVFAKEYLRGIDIFESLIKNLCDGI